MELLPQKKQRLDIYLDAYEDAIMNNKYQKAVYFGIKISGIVPIDMESLWEGFGFYDTVLSCVSKLTPNQLMQIFPIIKRYDGDRWQVKDYYSTMDAVYKKGLNNQIGDSVFDFLWDYHNNSIGRFLANYLLIVNHLRKRNGEESIIDWMSRNWNLRIYYERTDPTTGKKYLFDPKSGKTVRLKKSYPKYVKIVK